MSSILILTKNISLQTKFKSFNFMLYFWKRNLKIFFFKNFIKNISFNSNFFKINSKTKKLSNFFFTHKSLFINLKKNNNNNNNNNNNLILHNFNKKKLTFFFWNFFFYSSFIKNNFFFFTPLQSFLSIKKSSFFLTKNIFTLLD